MALPPNVRKLSLDFMAWHHLYGTPEVKLTPTTLTFIFPNWTGTQRNLSDAIEGEGRNFEDRLREALSSEDYVTSDVRVSVQGTDAVVVFELRPYDPDEDGAF